MERLAQLKGYLIGEKLNEKIQEHDLKKGWIPYEVLEKVRERIKQIQDEIDLLENKDKI